MYSKETQEKNRLCHRPLTARQRETLNFIVRCIRKRGYAPSLREIAKNLGGTTTNNALSHLKALERKGCIRRKANISRSIQVIGREGKVPQGLAIGAEIRSSSLHPLSPQERLHLQDYFPTSGDDFFFVRVQDETLGEHDFHLGDLLILQRSQTARFDERVLFHPAMPYLLGVCKMDPITQKTYLRPLSSPEERLPNDSLTLFGILIGVLRLEKT